MTHEEKIVDVLARGVLGVLRDNPWIAEGYACQPRVHISPHDFRILEKDIVLSPGAYGDARPVDGRIDYDTAQISICTRLDPQVKTETLWHEIIHALIDYSCLTASKGENESA